MKSALLSYLPHKVSNKPDKELFGNQLYAKYLPKVLNELGYVVDYIDWQDTSFKPDKEYDLFMGHGGYNFTRYAPHANKSIYFSTGFESRMFNALEDERFYELYLRRSVRLEPDRRITSNEAEAIKRADAIITLGNEITGSSYVSALLHGRVYPIGGMTAQVGQDVAQKDFELGRKHFLFYSGAGPVHKGLDLLIEAFVRTNLHLHICQTLSPDFLGIYHFPEIGNNNIHYHGKIDINGDTFNKLIKSCNWVISATCCEGCPSAILECMAHGLIPVVTANASIQMDGGAYIETDNIEIAYICKDLSEMENLTMRAMAETAQNTARTYYSPQAFSLRLKEAIQAIV